MMSIVFLFAFAALFAATMADDDSCGFEFTKENLNQQIYENLRTAMTDGYRFGVTEFRPLNPFFRQVDFETSGSPAIKISNYNVYGLQSFEDRNCRAEKASNGPNSGTKVRCKLGFKKLRILTQDFTMSGRYATMPVNAAGSLAINLNNVEMEMVLFLQSCTNAIILLGNANKDVTYESMELDTNDMESDKDKKDKNSILKKALTDKTQPLRKKFIPSELEQVANAFANVLVTQFELILEASYSRCDIHVNSKTIPANCGEYKNPGLPVTP